MFLNNLGELLSWGQISLLLSSGNFKKLFVICVYVGEGARITQGR